jgi:hypothetical protein
MPELSGQMGELRFTLEIVRKETGLTDKVELIGYLDAEKLKELQNGSNSLDGSTERSD